jgi:hypothetical protein
MGQSIHALSFELVGLSGLLLRHGGLKVRLADEMSASDKIIDHDIDGFLAVHEGLSADGGELRLRHEVSSRLFAASRQSGEFCGEH